MTVRIVVGGLFLLWALGQVRMLLVYLGRIPSTFGIVGTPTLVFRASTSIIFNVIRAALCFLVSWPMLLPVLAASLFLAPLVMALAHFGVFGERVACAADPMLKMVNEKGLGKYSIDVLCGTLIWFLVVAGLAGGLWYFFAR